MMRSCEAAEGSVLKCRPKRQENRDPRSLRWRDSPQRHSCIFFRAGTGDEWESDSRQHLNVEDLFHARLKIEKGGLMSGPQVDDGKTTF